MCPPSQRHTFSKSFLTCCSLRKLSRSFFRCFRSLYLSFSRGRKTCGCLLLTFSFVVKQTFLVLENFDCCSKSKAQRVHIRSKVTTLLKTQRLPSSKHKKIVQIENASGAAATRMSPWEQHQTKDWKARRRRRFVPLSRLSNFDVMLQARPAAFHRGKRQSCVVTSLRTPFPGGGQRSSFLRRDETRMRRISLRSLLRFSRTKHDLTLFSSRNARLHQLFTKCFTLDMLHPLLQELQSSFSTDGDKSQRAVCYTACRSSRFAIVSIPAAYQTTTWRRRRKGGRESQTVRRDAYKRRKVRLIQETNDNTR